MLQMNRFASQKNIAMPYRKHKQIFGKAGELLSLDIIRRERMFSSEQKTIERQPMLRQPRSWHWGNLVAQTQQTR